MNVDLYERLWMWGVAVILTVFFSTTAAGLLRSRHSPPSHVETIDPRTVLTDPRFRQQGVTVGPDGRVTATVIGLTFAWLPPELTVPATTPVTFRLTSVDVTHGFQIVRSNGQTMTIPGYVSQFTTRFDTPGEYLIVCNEYCGTGHHTMAGKLHVVPQAEWRQSAMAAKGGP